MDPVKIVLLNNDPVIRKRFNTCFRPPLYEVLIPDTPIEALVSASDPLVRVAIMDTAFHHIDLLVFIDRLKALNSRIQILVTASIHSEEIEKAARWAGALSYKTKPFDLRIFKKIVDWIVITYPAIQRKTTFAFFPETSRYERI